MDNNSNILKYSSSIESFLYEREQSFLEYDVKRIYDKDTSGLKLRTNYDSIDEYIKSKLYNYSFETAYIVDDKDFYQFQTQGEYYRNNIFSNSIESTFKYNIDEVNINIKFYNVVIDSNADFVDEKSNIYTWKLDRSNINEIISFQLSNKVRYDVMFFDYINRHKILLIVVTVIIFLIIYGLMKLKQIIKKNNSI